MEQGRNKDKSQTVFIEAVWPAVNIKITLMSVNPLGITLHYYITKNVPL